MNFQRSVRVLASVALILAPTVESFSQAVPEPAQPYFRFKTGQDAGTVTPPIDPDSLLVVTGVGGSYLTRRDGTPAMPTPQASRSPVTWTVSGTLPTGLGFDEKTGAVTGTACT